MSCWLLPLLVLFAVGGNADILPGEPTPDEKNYAANWLRFQLEERTGDQANDLAIFTDSKNIIKSNPKTLYYGYIIRPDDNGNLNWFGKWAAVVETKTGTREPTGRYTFISRKKNKGAFTRWYGWKKFHELLPGDPTQDEKDYAANWLRAQLSTRPVTGDPEKDLAIFSNKEKVIPKSSNPKKLYYGYIIRPDADGNLNWFGKWRAIVETKKGTRVPTGRYTFIAHTDNRDNKFDKWDGWKSF